MSLDVSHQEAARELRELAEIDRRGQLGQGDSRCRDRVQPIRNVGLLALPGCIFAHLTGERIGQSGGYARHLEAGFQQCHVDAAVSCHLLALDQRRTHPIYDDRTQRIVGGGEVLGGIDGLLHGHLLEQCHDVHCRLRTV